VIVVTDDLPAPDGPGSALTIGAFDGVHLGHRAVIRRVRELADGLGVAAGLVTFDRHPARVVRPASAPRLLTSLEQRLELLEATGLLDHVWLLSFDAARATERAEDFVALDLVGRMRARAIVVGEDFHFGYRRGGNVELLRTMGADAGFTVEALDLLPIEGSAPGDVVSSTRIRTLLAGSDVAGAARLLGRPHEVRGVVAPGDRRGGTFGFPTANVVVDPELCLPAEGIYAGTVVTGDGVERPAAISLGRRPTFDDAGDLRLEAHILDFDGDLYHQQVAVRFVRWLRGEKRYDSVDALATQLRADVAETRRGP
jgi:riboflavin kinase / FMN adenylyltransferase